MAKIDDVKKLWKEGFRDTPEFMNLMFNKVYRDSDAMTLLVDDKVVSSLLLQDYEFKYWGHSVRMGYVSGATTLRQYRGRGFMKELLMEALKSARERSMPVVSLIPASRALYFMYDKLDFATVFYFEPQRFTALHQFESVEGYRVTDDFAEIFSDLEQSRKCGVLHSRDQINAICADVKLDDGFYCAVVRHDDPSSRAVVVAVPQSEGKSVDVKELLSTDPEAEEYALSCVRERFPDDPIFIMAYPAENRQRGLDVRGMLRVTDAKPLLDILAEANPKLNLSIKITDPLLEWNNHTYIIGKGACRIEDATERKLDFDIDIATFAKLLFGSPAIGTITGIPSFRPEMRLMLD